MAAEGWLKGLLRIALDNVLREVVPERGSTKIEGSLAQGKVTDYFQNPVTLSAKEKNDINSKELQIDQKIQTLMTILRAPYMWNQWVIKFTVTQTHNWLFQAHASCVVLKEAEGWLQNHDHEFHLKVN